MTRRSIIIKALLTGLTLFTLSRALMAQVPRAPYDGHGTIDTVSIELRQFGSLQWEATIHLFNDENVAALTLPLVWHPGGRALLIDSASYLGTRTSYFALKTFFPDTAAGTVLVGLISDLGTGLPPLEPGRGPIARLFFTAAEAGVAPRLDTTFIRPHNVLQLVTPDVRAILPAFNVHNVLSDIDDARR